MEVDLTDFRRGWEGKVVWWCGKWNGPAFDGEGPTDSGHYCTNERSLSGQLHLSGQLRHSVAKYGCGWYELRRLPEAGVEGQNS